MSKENNIPAFPQNPDCLAAEEEGMTLRDYFAAKALPGLMIMPESEWSWDFSGVNGDETTQSDIFASAAYSIADAMLEARKK